MTPENTCLSLTKVKKTICSFGKLDIKTQRFHKGYIDKDENMCFEERGEPSLMQVDIDAKPLSFTPKIYSWWQKDKNGWPIEQTVGHPFSNFIRIIIQNIRKLD